jgi:hypothetical protein
MAVLVALLALATAAVIGAAMISRRPALGAAAALLGVATLVTAYLTIKDYLPIILAVLLGVAAVAAGAVLVGRFLQRPQ